MAIQTNIENFLRDLKAHQERVIAGAKAGMNEVAQATIGNAQDYCPVDSGKLQESGTAEPAEIEGNIITAKMGFNKDYAAIVHETWRPGLPNSQNDNPKARPKFLAVAVQEMSLKMTGIIAKAIEESVGK